MKLLFKYLYIIELFLFSGTFSFSTSRPKLALSTWVLSSLLMVVIYKKKVSNYNFRVILIITIWILFIQFATTTSSFDNTYLTYILYPFACALGFAQFSYGELRNRLLNVFSSICLLSLIAQLSYDFLHISPSYVRDPTGMVFTTYFGLFNLSWAGESGISSFHRMSSIFWEPGQFQIVCFYILCLFTDRLTSINNIRNIDYRFIPIFIDLVYSQSTMGYIVLALFITIILLFRRKNSMFTIKSLIATGVALAVSVVVVVEIFNSTAVQNKMDQRADIGQQNSYNIRMMDNMACLQATMDSPIFGLGINSEELKRRLLSYGNTTSSNGWLYTSACLGIPFVLMFFFFMYKRLQERKLNVPSMLLLLILIISHCNETMIFFPYVYLYIFKIYPANNESKSNLKYQK